MQRSKLYSLKNWLKNGVVDSELKNLVEWLKELPQCAETETDGLETEESSNYYFLELLLSYD